MAKKTYETVNFKSVKIDYIYPNDTTDGKIGNFQLSKKGNGWTVSFRFQDLESGDMLNGCVFITKDNEKKYINKFFREFSEGAVFQSVKATAKTNDNNKTSFNLNLGYAEPIRGMSLAEMREKAGII